MWPLRPELRHLLRSPVVDAGGCKGWQVVARPAILASLKPPWPALAMGWSRWSSESSRHRGCSPCASVSWGSKPRHHRAVGCEPGLRCLLAVQGHPSSPPPPLSSWCYYMESALLSMLSFGRGLPCWLLPLTTVLRRGHAVLSACPVKCSICTGPGHIPLLSPPSLCRGIGKWGPQSRT